MIRYLGIGSGIGGIGSSIGIGGWGGIQLRLCVGLVWSALRPGRPQAARRAGQQRELGRPTAWRADAAPGRRQSPPASWSDGLKPA